MSPILSRAGFSFGFGRRRNVGGVVPNNFLSSQTFSYTGSPQSFNTPLNTTFIRAKVWGGGGGGSLSPGGAGGMVDAYIPVTAGSTITIYVAKGGTNTPGPGGPVGPGGYGYGTGGNGGSSDVSGSNGSGGGGGGGSSAIITPLATNIIAAGGGASGGQNWAGNPGSAGGNSPGNSAGGPGGGPAPAGGGGSNQSGGGGGGGSGSNAGGNGGSGGSAGTNQVPSPTPFGTNSGYNGSGTTAARNSDPDWSSGIGAGAPSGFAAGPGGNGKVVVYYTA